MPKLHAPLILSQSLSSRSGRSTNRCHRATAQSHTHYRRRKDLTIRTSSIVRYPLNTAGFLTRRLVGTPSHKIAKADQLSMSTFFPQSEIRIPLGFHCLQIKHHLSRRSLPAKAETSDI